MHQPSTRQNPKSETFIIFGDSDYKLKLETKQSPTTASLLSTSAPTAERYYCHKMIKDTI